MVTGSNTVLEGPCDNIFFVSDLRQGNPGPSGSVGRTLDW